jgi:hypothetical protein
MLEKNLDGRSLSPSLGLDTVSEVSNVERIRCLRCWVSTSFDHKTCRCLTFINTHQPTTMSSDPLPSEAEISACTTDLFHGYEHALMQMVSHILYA